jgi:hypothetical protein
MRGNVFDRYFYLFMALLIPVVVAYGFSFTIGPNLLYPAVPRPAVLYVHAAVFSGWLAFFLLQAALVRTRRVSWHRRTGIAGAALGAGVVLVGVATALTMGRFNTRVGLSATAASDLLVPLFDMLAFACSFAAAIVWRRRPDYHRRLVLVATCTLTAAAFGRFPDWLLPPGLFYAGVDILILLGVARDLLVDGKPHPVYLYALPALVAGQALVIFTVMNRLEPWTRVGRALLG